MPWTKPRWAHCGHLVSAQCSCAPPESSPFVQQLREQMAILTKHLERMRRP